GGLIEAQTLGKSAGKCKDWRREAAGDYRKAAGRVYREGGGLGAGECRGSQHRIMHGIGELRRISKLIGRRRGDHRREGGGECGRRDRQNNREGGRARESHLGCHAAAAEIYSAL